MYGWERRVLLEHYLEQSLSKTAIAERVAISRRTIYYWLATGQLERDVQAAVHYPPRLTKLGVVVSVAEDGPGIDAKALRAQWRGLEVGADA